MREAGKEEEVVEHSEEQMVDIFQVTARKRDLKDQEACLAFPEKMTKRRFEVGQFSVKLNIVHFIHSLVSHLLTTCQMLAWCEPY